MRKIAVTLVLLVLNSYFPTPAEAFGIPKIVKKALLLPVYIVMGSVIGGIMWSADQNTEKSNEK